MRSQSREARNVFLYRHRCIPDVDILDIDDTDTYIDTDDMPMRCQSREADFFLDYLREAPGAKLRT